MAFSDEIGHFEYCAAKTRGRCTSAGASDPSGVDADDRGCLTTPTGMTAPFGTLTGCSSTDIDFDGPEYSNNWPGTDPNPATDAAMHVAPIVFSSPLFTGLGASGLFNYRQVAFEADLPRIEDSTNPPCQRHVTNPADPNPGAGCVNPPVGATFYPIFTTGVSGGECIWQEGGAFIPGTTNTFGGTSTAEYGGLLLWAYPAAGNSITLRYNNFRNILNHNSCQSSGGKNGG